MRAPTNIRRSAFFHHLHTIFTPSQLVIGVYKKVYNQKNMSNLQQVIFPLTSGATPKCGTLAAALIHQYQLTVTSGHP